ncbi:MAG: GIY-YIG nuclease family protein [Candidatus Komeilibacteria bacterium]|nr:GIY-YIG nuclease family protein [Candidatus Komeilibacteria bacterium]
MIKKYYFYFARCSDKSLYAGYCVNLKQREDKHNSGDGAKYTRQRRPIKIIYSEQFDSISKAMKREAQVKGWIKDKKEKLIKGLL